MSNYKTALVTGASAGFGYAIAKKLAASGIKVVACARREDKLKELSAQNSNIYPCRLDVSDRKSVESLSERLPEGLRDIDVLINNAGLALSQDRAQECSLDEWQTMVDTNISGVLYMTRKFLPAMVRRNLGYIINIGSTAGSWPYAGGNVYGGTKAFVEQFSRNLRTDLKGTAVKVTIVKPGLCGDTEFSSVRFHGDQNKVDSIYSDTDSVTPEDIADTILWLVNTPAHMNVNDMEIMPVCQTYAGLSVEKKLSLEPKV